MVRCFALPGDIMYIISLSLSRQVALQILTETQRKASSRTYITSISVISSQVNDVRRRCDLSSSEDIVGVL